MREVKTGKFYDCQKCGEEFYISWDENGCQCSECLPNLCPDCFDKLNSLNEKS